MQHGYKTQHSTVAVLHTLNNTVAKGFKQMTYPCANNHCSTRYEQSYRHNKHTHTSQKTAISSCSSSWSWLYTRIPGTIIKFITNYIKGRKVNPTYRNHILKPTFLKLASFHPHYLIYPLQTCHHSGHRFRSCLMQMTSPSHLVDIRHWPMQIYYMEVINTTTINNYLQSS